jgi:hypothetical protein
MIRENVGLAVFPAESVTVAEKLYGLPATSFVMTVLVAESTPAALRANPVGRFVAAQVYPVPDPPVAVNVVE